MLGSVVTGVAFFGATTTDLVVVRLLAAVTGSGTVLRSNAGAADGATDLMAGRSGSVAVPFTAGVTAAEGTLAGAWAADAAGVP